MSRDLRAEAAMAGVCFTLCAMLAFWAALATWGVP